MMILKQIKDMYNESGLWLTATEISVIGDWSTLDNLTALDRRIYDKFSEKYLSSYLQKLTNEEITQRVVRYINSIEYELDTLYQSTQEEYDPISNYDMTETGSDSTSSTAGGSTTSFSTTYDDSSTERETGKNTTSGNTSESFSHSLTRKGNIGVTSTQQLLQSQRDIARFDFIGYVADKIISEYTAALYNPIAADMEVII